MTNIIDRTDSGNRGTHTNRKKFLDRNRRAIKRAVQDAVQDSTIKDLGKESVDVTVTGGTDEWVFTTKPGTGVSDQVHPGNDQWQAGDAIGKPPSGGGGGRGSKGGQGEDGEDEFKFQISSKEFIDYFMDDLQLPNLAKKQLTVVESSQWKRQGFSNEGTPGQLNIIKTFKNSHARRLAQLAGLKRKIKELEEELKKDSKNKELKESLLRAKKGLKKVIFLDDMDIKYNRLENVPETKFNAVMFCLMDTSYSMDEERKDLAKRYYILLHLFLRRYYSKVDVVFVQHTDTAAEVDEETFFYGQRSGGTMISSGVRLINKIIAQRYPEEQWNMYVAQASDGDNFDVDNEALHKELDSLIPKLQYFSYIDLQAIGGWGFTGNASSLWKLYDSYTQTYPHFKRAAVQNATHIWRVFRDLFKKRDEK